MKAVWILTSPTYVSQHEDAPFDAVIVGVFATREAAEAYRDNATPPVTDGKIVDWTVEGNEPEVANLGLASNSQILHELRTRIEVDHYNGGMGLEYSTVGGRGDR